MSVAGSPQSNEDLTPQPLTTFEFTKRKRWADILITALVDVIIFILSPEGKVLYCGAAVRELLGWSETDMLDLHLNGYIHDEDQSIFQRSLEDSVRANTELVTYVRFKRNFPRPCHLQSNDILFELKGHPHFVAEQGPQCKCFYVTAKPYPNKNTSLLNAFLGQRIEYERLQQRAAMLRTIVNTQITPANPTDDSVYATPLQYGSQYSNSYDDSMKSPPGAHCNSDHFGNSYSFRPLVVPEMPDDGLRIKKPKLKKTQGTEQHVCKKCGRTDSPEWRKGPDGPKTLCNACGLRWAKQMRKSDRQVHKAKKHRKPSTSRL